MSLNPETHKGDGVRNSMRRYPQWTRVFFDAESATEVKGEIDKSLLQWGRGQSSADWSFCI
jgi:hypothetical protein